MPRPLPRPTSRTVARAVVAAAALVLLLAGCGGDEDISAEQFSTDLQERTGTIPETEEQVVPPEVADCFTEKVYDEFDQQEINRIYHAADEDELGNTTRDKLNEFNQACFTAYTEAQGSETSSTTEASSTTEGSSTTEASSDGSSTTEG